MSKLSSIALSVTFQCNIKCRHCGLSCSPDEKDWMSMDEIYMLTNQADKAGCVGVVLTGGEPTLIKHEDLLSYFRYVKKETQIQNIRIVTNGHWAKTYEKAYQILKEWKEAGLDELNVSCGEYHQEFVPINNIANAYKAGKDLNYRTVLLAGEFIKSDSAKLTPYDFEEKLGERIRQVNELSHFTTNYWGIDCKAAINVGRGSEYIKKEYIPKEQFENLKNACDHLINSISFQADGKVEACCAVMVRDHPVLTIGNWREEKLDTIVERGHNDLIINWFRYLGVKDLLQWIKQMDPSITIKNDFMDICDICNAILLNPKCIKLIEKHGAQKRDEILFSKLSKEATIFNTNYSY